MTLVPAQIDPLQLRHQLEIKKSQISNWLDSRKVEYTFEEIGQFRGYSSKILKSIQDDVQKLADQKLSAIRKDRDAKIAACTSPKKRIVLLGLFKGATAVFSGYSCFVVALKATTSLLFWALVCLGVLVIYFLGKLCIETLNASRSSVMNAKTSADAQRVLITLEQARISLQRELVELRGEMIDAEGRLEIAALKNANDNVPGVVYWLKRFD